MCPARPQPPLGELWLSVRPDTQPFCRNHMGDGAKSRVGLQEQRQKEEVAREWTEEVGGSSFVLELRILMTRKQLFLQSDQKQGFSTTAEHCICLEKLATQARHGAACR